MGHYDEQYEADAAEELQERNQHTAKINKKLLDLEKSILDINKDLRYSAHNGGKLMVAIDKFNEQIELWRLKNGLYK